MAEQTSPQAENPASSTVKPTKKKWLKRSLCIGSAVVFVPVFGILGALSFDAGQRGLIQLVDKLLPSLSIEKVSGGLQQGLVLDNVRYQTAGIDTQIAQARLQMDFGCLLSRQICVEEIRVHQPHILIDTSQLPPSPPQEKSDSAPMSRISMPISLDVKNIALDELHLQLDNTQIDLNSFQSAVSLNNENGLTLAPTAIRDIQVLSQQSETSTPASPPLEPRQPIDWAQIEANLTPAFLGNVQEIILPFDFHIPAIEGTNWQYRAVDEKGNETQSIAIPRVMVQADATGNKVQLQTLDVESSLGNLAASGNLQLDGEMPLDVALKSSLNTFKSTTGRVILPASKLDLSLSGMLQKTTALSLKTQGVLDATLQGEVQLAQDKMPLNLTLNVAKGEYAFVPTMSPLKIQNVTAQITGDLLNYHAEVKGNVEGIDYTPPTQVNLNADGKLYEVSVNQLKLDALGGKGELVGFVSWKDGVMWDAKADLNKMNIRPYVPAMPAVLSGSLQSTGSAANGHWAVDVPVADLTGSLNNRPISLKGAVALNDKTLLNIPDLKLDYGDNHIQAKGILGDESDLALTLQAPNLTGLWADLSGGVNGSAKVKGKLSAPSLNVDLNAPRLHFQDLTLVNTQIKGDVVSEPSVKGNLNLSAAQVQYGETVKLQNIQLTASGDESAHQLNLKSQGEPAAGNLQINGKFDRTSQQWQGTLSQVSVETPIGVVKPNQSIGVTYSNERVQAQIAAHCWQHQHAELCFPQTFSAGKTGEIPFQLKRLNLALVNQLIEQDSLNGQLSAQGNVAWFADKPFQLKLDVNGDNVNLAQKLDYRTLKLAFPTLRLNAEAQNNNLTAKADINVQNQGRINGELNIKDLSGARQLGGSLSIDRLSLTLFNQLLTQGESINGEIVSKLTFAGDLNKPLLNGEFALRNVKTKLKSSPIEVTQGDVTVRFQGNQSTLLGKIETADSRLNLSGKANWADIQRWNAEVTAQADNFKVEIPSMAKLRVSPNITVKATPTVLDLTGEVAIPWARVKVDSLPDSAEPVSEDEVILNGPNKSKDALIKREFAAKTQSGMEIRSDLKISIGKDVNLNAYGLKTDLDGLLTVRQDKGKLGLFGQINLSKGRYASFGQDLVIRKGQISFAGQPAQPYLNIEAIRNPEAMEDSNVTAGVKVVGVADSPEVTIFSEPSKPQDQALSYLLTGRTLEDSGQAGSGGSIGAALLGMGLAKSGKLVGGIGEAFGIQDLNLGTAGVGDKSKVMVSGNITNRLQIKYGVGLFDGLAEVTLRYRLLPKLYFQSVSSTNQVFDLLYQFEF